MLEKQFSFAELWEQLLSEEESNRIEAKTGSEVGKSVLESVSAFSNEQNFGGGYLLLGIGEVKNQRTLFGDRYEIIGVDQPEKIQNDLVTRCRNDLEPPIALQVEVHTAKSPSGDEKQVVVAFIPEASAQDKPVFIRKQGIQRGSYRRLGAGDHRCMAEDIEVFLEDRKGLSYDQRILPDADFDDIDERAISEYRRQRKIIRRDAPEIQGSDDEMLRAIGAIRKDEEGVLGLTVAGLVLFGKALALRRLAPLLRVDYIRVQGTEWVEDAYHRFSTIEFLEPAILALPRIIAQAADDFLKAFSIEKESSQREEIPAIPYLVLREAIVNAVMHRSYRTRQAIQIIRYSNRIEIRNPGVSLVPDERLGEPESKTRNGHVAGILHDLRFAENKGSGIRAMRKLMKDAGLSNPIFRSDREVDSFSATFYAHHFFDEDNLSWLANFREYELTQDDSHALLAVRTNGRVTNSEYRDFAGSNDTLGASKALKRLRDLGLLAQRGKGNAVYYSAGPALLVKSKTTLPDSGASLPDTGASLPDTGASLPDTGASLPDTGASEKIASALLSETSQEESILLAAGAEATRRLSSLGKRLNTKKMNELILLLCFPKPRGSAELAEVLGRTRNHLSSQNLVPLKGEGLLAFSLPDDPTSPRQRVSLTESGRMEVIEIIELSLG